MSYVDAVSYAETNASYVEESGIVLLRGGRHECPTSTRSPARSHAPPRWRQAPFFDVGVVSYAETCISYVEEGTTVLR